MKKHRELHKAGFKIFGLHSLNEDGTCTCLNEECEALYKHPRISGWQKTQHWSDEQLKNIEDLNWFDTGYGVLVDGFLVVDVDARNGGVDSFYQLQDDLDLELEELCGYIVQTGSGNGSMHLYFKLNDTTISLMQNIKDYEGIDFKSSGFVVGDGSKHISGNPYQCIKGSPFDLTEAPQALIDAIRQPERMRSKYNGETIDFALPELAEIVMHIDNNAGEYEKWLKVGMAIHDATGGSLDGLSLWETWDQHTTPDKYDSSASAFKWDTFGKGGSVATIGTLIYYAQQNGYTFPKRWDNLIVFENEKTSEKDDLLGSGHIDIRRPMGFVGELAQWINDQCLYPRENLAVAAALYVVSCAGGMRHIDEINGMSANLIMFCVAGSGSGKDPILQAINDLLESFNGLPALHGAIKSEQEILRNLIRNQAAFYAIDELGYQMQKVQKAMSRGGATYLEGVFAILMSAYSRAGGTLAISGDLKEEIRADILREIAVINKKIDQGQQGLEEKLDQLTDSLKSIEGGIKNPYLSMFGVTTGSTFDGLVDQETATNGFMARAIIFEEHETNPRRKEGFKKKPLPMHIQAKLVELYWGSSYNTQSPRVEQKGQKSIIKTEDDAIVKLDEVYEYFHAWAERVKSENGLEAIPRRGWEICSKISLNLAMGDGVRTVDHVLYGFAIAKHDIEAKLKLAESNRNEESPNEAAKVLVLKIQRYLTEEPITVGVLKNKNQYLRKQTEEDIIKAIDHLVKMDLAIKEERTHPNGKKIISMRARK